MNKTKTPKRPKFANRLARRDRAAARKIREAGLSDLPVGQALGILGYSDEDECLRLVSALVPE